MERIGAEIGRRSAKRRLALSWRMPSSLVVLRPTAYVVREDPESNAARDSVVPTIPGASESVASFKEADGAFDTGRQACALRKVRERSNAFRPQMILLRAHAAVPVWRFEARLRDWSLAARPLARCPVGERANAACSRRKWRYQEYPVTSEGTDGAITGDRRHGAGAVGRMSVRMALAGGAHSAACTASPRGAALPGVRVRWASDEASPRAGDRTAGDPGDDRAGIPRRRGQCDRPARRTGALKARLLQEAADAAAERLLVVQALGHEVEQAHPFALVHQILEGLLAPRACRQGGSPGHRARWIALAAFGARRGAPHPPGVSRALGDGLCALLVPREPVGGAAAPRLPRTSPREGIP